jgi:hypothetical protein
MLHSAPKYERPCDGEHPKTVHIAQPCEEIIHDDNVVGARRGDLVVSFAEQFLPLIPDELAEAFRHLNVSPLAVYNGDINGLHLARCAGSCFFME